MILLVWSGVKLSAASWGDRQGSRVPCDAGRHGGEITSVAPEIISAAARHLIQCCKSHLHFKHTYHSI